MQAKLEDGAYLPCQAHPTDAGYDLQCQNTFYLLKGQSMSVDTGIHLRIPTGFVGIIKSKSGLNFRHDIIVEGDGVIDSGYIGSIKVKLRNNGRDDYLFKGGDKIAQILFFSVWTPNIEVVEELEETDRGENGFGSTGK